MPGPIQSLTRAAAILRLLAGGDRRIGLSDVASSLGLAKGTAHGILRIIAFVLLCIGVQITWNGVETLLKTVLHR